MERLASIDRNELICRMRWEFEKTMAEAVEAVTGAPDEHVIVWLGGALPGRAGGIPTPGL